MGDSKSSKPFPIYVSLRRKSGNAWCDAANALNQMLFAVPPIRQYFIDHTDKLGQAHRSRGQLFTIMMNQVNKGHTDCLVVMLNPDSDVFGAQLDELFQEPDEIIPFGDALQLLINWMQDFNEEANNPSPQTIVNFNPNSAEDAWMLFRKYRDTTELCELLNGQLETKTSFFKCKHQLALWTVFIYVTFKPSLLPVQIKISTNFSLSDYIRCFLSEQVS